MRTTHFKWIKLGCKFRGRQRTTIFCCWESQELLLRAVRTNKIVRNICALFVQTVEFSESRPLKYFMDILFGNNYCNFNRKNAGPYTNWEFKRTGWLSPVLTRLVHPCLAVGKQVVPIATFSLLSMALTCVFTPPYKSPKLSKCVNSDFW